MDTNSNWTRRYFLTAACTGAAVSMLTLKHKPVLASEDAATVPTRPFGKAGVEVPILGFGTSLHVAFGPDVHGWQ
jgi:hypothetical protein